jgi:hypothetical protein
MSLPSSKPRQPNLHETRSTNHGDQLSVSEKREQRHHQTASRRDIKIRKGATWFRPGCQLKMAEHYRARSVGRGSLFAAPPL